MFAEARTQHRFTEHELSSFATKVANSSKWVADKIGAHEKQVRKKGKVKPGKRQWIKSRNYHRIQAKKAEIERKKAAYTKSQNRGLVNEILRHSTTHSPTSVIPIHPLNQSLLSYS